MCDVSKPPEEATIIILATVDLLNSSANMLGDLPCEDDRQTDILNAKVSGLHKAIEILEGYLRMHRMELK